MSKRSFYGWAELIIGILLVAAGIFSLFHPNRIMSWIVVIYGLIAIATGIADIAFYIRTDRFTGFGPTLSLVGGIFSIMVGVMLLMHPAAGQIITMLLIPIWFLAHCISQLSHLSMIRVRSNNFEYYLTLIINIIGIVLAIMMFFSPYLTFLATGLIIGIYLIAIGAHLISMAIGNI